MSCLLGSLAFRVHIFLSTFSCLGSLKHRATVRLTEKKNVQYQVILPLNIPYTPTHIPIKAETDNGRQLKLLHKNLAEWARQGGWASPMTGNLDRQTVDGSADAMPLVYAHR